MSMRIAFDGTALRPRRTGVGYYTEHLLHHLAREASHDEVVVLSNRDVETTSPLPPTVRVAVSGRQMPRMVWMQLGAPAALHALDADVAHFTNGMVPIASPAPTVVTIHDMSLRMYPRYHPLRRVLLNLPLVDLAAKRADAIVTVSESAKHDIVRLYALNPDRVHVVHEAAAPSFHRVTDPAELDRVRRRYGLADRTVLYVGTIEPRKNLPKLVEAFASRHRAGELPHQLVCVGPYGWVSRGLEDVMRRSKVADAIRFTGYVPFEDLPALYSLAEIFVYPSMYEGFGLPVIEAMACGAPVVTGRAAALAEVGGDAVEKVDRIDADGFGEAMVRLARDPQRRAELSARGLARAAQFSWTRAARQTVNIYREVARTRVAVRRTHRSAPARADATGPAAAPAVDVLFGQAYFLRFDPKLWAAQQPYAPLGSLYAAACVRERGYRVALFDAMLATSEAEWADALDRHRPRFAVFYEENFISLIKMCLLLKRPAALAPAPRLLLDERRDDARVSIPLQLVREADLRSAVQRAVAGACRRRNGVAQPHVRARSSLLRGRHLRPETRMDSPLRGAGAGARGGDAVQVPAARGSGDGRYGRGVARVALPHRVAWRRIGLAAHSRRDGEGHAGRSDRRRVAPAAGGRHRSLLLPAVRLSRRDARRHRADAADGPRLPSRRHRRLGVLPASGDDVLPARAGAARTETELDRFQRSRDDVSRDLRSRFLSGAARVRARRIPGAPCGGPIQARVHATRIARATRVGRTGRARADSPSSGAAAPEAARRSPRADDAAAAGHRHRSAPLTAGRGDSKRATAMTPASLATATLVRLGEISNRTFVLPLAVFYPTSRCNSRCISCDWWRQTGAGDLTLEEIDTVAASLSALGTQLVVFSGGEPLLRPEVFDAARSFRARAITLHLLTSGILLERSAERVVEQFARVCISLDATDEPLYQRIRGVAALRTVERGVARLRQLAPRLPVTARSTLQRENFRQVGALIDHAHRLGLDGISFLPADVSSTAFGRDEPPNPLPLMLDREEIADFEAAIERTIQVYARDFASGFIAESPDKLRRLPRYYSALAGEESFPPVSCNAPWVSVVVEANGGVRPCFFHDAIGNVREMPLEKIVATNLRAFRESFDVGSDPVCAK